MARNFSVEAIMTMKTDSGGSEAESVPDDMNNYGLTTAAPMTNEAATAAAAAAAFAAMTPKLKFFEELQKKLGINFINPDSSLLYDRQIQSLNY